MGLARGRSCVCGGSNSNCCLCYGTGVLGPSGLARPAPTGPPKVRVQPVAPSFFRPSTSVPKASMALPPFIRCRWCNALVNSAFVNRHLQEHHPRSQRPVLRKSTAIPNRQLNSLQGEKRGIDGPKPPLVRCSLCPALVRETRIATHMRRVHPVAVARLPRLNARPRD
jgi:hypothetical protein